MSVDVDCDDSVREQETNSILMFAPIKFIIYVLVNLLGGLAYFLGS